MKKTGRVALDVQELSALDQMPLCIEYETGFEDDYAATRHTTFFSKP